MGVTDDNFIKVVTSRNDVDDFFYDGRYSKVGEPLLFPSEEMRDWNKLTWKKGDVLISDNFCNEVIFDSFINDFTSFKAKHLLDSTDDYNQRYAAEITCFTEDYNLEGKDAAQDYLNTIEKRLGGKLNMETLEVENSKPKCEFKALDYVLSNDNDDDEWVLCQFSHIDKHGNVVFVGGSYSDRDKVIPYNENTAHLIGTTEKNYKEK